MPLSTCYATWNTIRLCVWDDDDTAWSQATAAQGSRGGGGGRRRVERVLFALCVLNFNGSSGRRRRRRSTSIILHLLLVVLSSLKSLSLSTSPHTAQFGFLPRNRKFVKKINWQKGRIANHAPEWCNIFKYYATVSEVDQEVFEGSENDHHRHHIGGYCRSFVSQLHEYGGPLSGGWMDGRYVGGWLSEEEQVPSINRPFFASYFTLPSVCCFFSFSAPSLVLLLMRLKLYMKHELVKNTSFYRRQGRRSFLLFLWLNGSSLWPLINTVH